MRDRLTTPWIRRFKLVFNIDQVICQSKRRYSIDIDSSSIGRQSNERGRSDVRPGIHDAEEYDARE
jgi:hypothetical protein